MKQIHVAWTTFQRRQVSMAPHCDFEVLFLPVERRSGIISKAFQYFRNSWRTLQKIREMKADVVWVQLPQVPLMWVALVYRLFFNHNATIIADCHNKMFRAPWSRFPFGVRLLEKCDMVLVHNDDVLEQAISLGVSPERLSVVEDPPATFTKPADCGKLPDIPRPWLVFPASFAEDEPIRELFAAAAATPEISYLLTGNQRNCRDQQLIYNAPENIHFMGFLARDDFDSLITSCDAVVALTRFDGIQLSVCGEAVGAGKPMLIADTSTLRRLFPAGSVFVDPENPIAIAIGARRVMDQLSQLQEAVLEQQKEITTRWWETRGSVLMRQVNKCQDGVDKILSRKGTKKVLAVASGGGHWVQLMRLRPLFEGMSVEYMATDAAYSVDAGKPVLAVRDANMWDKAALAVMFLQVLIKMVKVRPDVVITTGAAPGFAAIFFGKLMGARTIWLDSIANSEQMSSSGRHVRPFADLWLTQWEHLATPNGPQYLGSVL